MWVLLPNALGALHHKGQAIVRKTRRCRTPRKLRIVYAAAEAFPFVKVGGLADVAGALPKALARLGHDICVMLPKYAQIDEHAFGLTGSLFSQVIPMAGEFQEAHIYQSSAIQNVQVLFVANHTYFGREHVYGYDDDDARFLFFSKSVVKALPKLRWPVDIVHCNDWHTAMIPSYLASAASQGCSTQPATVLTIHNLVYQGPFTQRTLELLDTGSQNLSRLNDQKGIHLVIDALRDIMACNVQLIAMGVGDAKYERLFRQSMTTYPQHFAYHATPDEGLARSIYAGCDLSLFPSIFEPCGLGLLIGLRYGAISVVRRTGGLADTIPDYTAEPQRGLGFTFVEKKPAALLAAMQQALMVYRKEAEWQALIKRAMKADYSWAEPRQRL